jgi:hypothetical protein
MRIDTIDVDSTTLSKIKTVSIGPKQLETPSKALQVGKLRATDDVSSESRGVAEIYITADSAGLENSRHGWDGLAGKLKRQKKRALDEELVVPFVQYKDGGELASEHAAEIAKLQSNYGDLITTPLMTALVDAAEDRDDLSTTHVSNIVENTRTFLNAVDELGIKKPVMGMIPSISEECTDALLELYLEYGLQAFYVDFNRRSPMAKTQLDFVQRPLNQRLKGYGEDENCLVYAINASESRPVTNGRRSPDTVFAYTLGFDIVGDNHISPNYPEEVFEKIAAEAADGDIELRLFDAETFSIVGVPLDYLGSFLPSEAEIPIDRVRRRIDADPDQRFRYEKLINAELIGLYLNADGGFDIRDIYVALRSGPHTQEEDLDRVRELAEDVSSEES